VYFLPFLEADGNEGRVMSKLDIANEMLALDRKDREFYDNLSDEEKKKFSSYLMIRWGASVQGSADLQEYYLQSTNLRLNKHYFDINKTKHDKLNWLAATTISPGMGKQYHPWLGMKKKEGGTTAKVEKFLATLYPDMKESDVDLLASLNDAKDVKKLAEELGWTKEQIKKELG
jgi:hypothetical protein